MTNLSPAAAILLGAFQALDDGRNYVAIPALRDRLSALSHADFDGALNELRRARVLTCDAFDGRHERMPASWHGKGLVDGASVLFWAARRFDE